MLRLHRLLFATTLCIASLFGLNAHAASPLTDEECAAYGGELAEMFGSGHAAEICDHLDTASFAKRVGEGLPLKEAQIQDFSRGVQKGLRKNMGQFATGHFLRVQHVGSEQRALVRCRAENGAVNYMAFVCERRANGKPKWIDIYSYLTGEHMSQTSRRAALTLLNEPKPNVLNFLNAGEKEYLANSREITEILALRAKGEKNKALTKLKALPKTLQKEKFMLALRLQVTDPNATDGEYLAAITAWEAAYPGDASLDLVSIDGAFLRKDYDGAIRCVEALQKSLGGDAYLDFMKASIFVQEEKYDEARSSARQAVQTEPTLVQAYDALFTISLKTKRFADTVQAFNDFESHFPKADIAASIADDADYAEFRASSEYKDWLASRAKAEAPTEKPQ